MNSVPHIQASVTWIPAAIARHPALLAGACLAAGVAIGDSMDTNAGPLLAGALVVSLIALALLRSEIHSNRILGVLGICLTVIAFGSWRIAVTNSGRPSPSLTELTESGRRVNLFARIDGAPFQKSSGWRVPLDLISVKGQSGDLPVMGRVLLTSIPSLQGLRYGDYIRFDGRVLAPSLQRNPGGFDYANYLRRQGFDATVRPESQLSRWPQDNRWSLHNIADPVRQWIRETFDRYLGDDPQALLVGLLLGDTDRLPKPVYNAFRESGTSHLLAVSGANVWLVVGMILLPMYTLSVPRWPRTIIALVVIVFFSFLTRNEPSVVRASLMVSLILAGRLLWRPVAPINAVGAAAMIILLFSPAQLFRPGFQLSFAAVIGILIAVGRIEPMLRGFWRRRIVYTVVLFLVASVAATIATAPISAWHFGTVPIAGLISNLLMVPLAGLTAHLGLLLLPLLAITSAGGEGLAWTIEHLLSYSTRTAQFFAEIPWATLSWPSPSLFVLSNFVLGVLLILNWRHRYSWLRPCVYYICVAMSVTAATRLTTPAAPSVSISLLDTGQQRVVVLSSESGRAVGIIDDPGLDDELEQWVIQPFLRRQIGRPELDSWTTWRRLEFLEQSPRESATNELTWKRFYSQSDSDSLGKPRVWVDLWQSDSVDVLMFRDPPKDTTDRYYEVVAAHPPRRPLTLVVPSQGSVSWIRGVIDRLHPINVVLYGRQRYGQSVDEEIAFWRLRYPHVKFHSSAAHGGIAIDLTPDQVAISSTVTESSISGE